MGAEGRVEFPGEAAEGLLVADGLRRRREPSRLAGAMCAAHPWQDDLLLEELRRDGRLGDDREAACRRLAPEIDIRSVWTGSGYDPETDVLYSAYLPEQSKRSGPAAPQT